MSVPVELRRAAVEELRHFPTPDEWHPTLEARSEWEMKDLITRLRQQGIEATGRVGYCTIVTTETWCVGVVNQDRDWRMIVSSYRLPESISSLSQQDTELLKRAVNSSGFANNPDLTATRELIGYAHRMLSVSPGVSPVLIAEEELLRRMTVVTR